MKFSQKEKMEIFRNEYLTRKAEEDKRRRMQRRVTKRMATAYRELEREETKNE